MISICKQFEFHAAHHLTCHEGLCKNLHGHAYILEIEITGEIQDLGPQTGMIMDFGNLKKIVHEHIIDKLDHSYLNETCPVYPTAENMVIWIAYRLQQIFS